MCTHMQFHEGYATGIFAPSCGAFARELVVDPMLDFVADRGRKIHRGRHPLLCNFTFDDSQRPQHLSWEIVSLPRCDGAGGVCVQPIARFSLLAYSALSPVLPP
mmetsp:Transcript_98073/g.282127  ORF Transcript_98073/g.282127 Transcript_98073/m.282127 type:complete len:104 (+) Transcript_98073:66-377(+)